MSQAKSSSGRETSFGLPTSGFKGWIPCLLKDGSHSKREPQESYKHCITNQEYTPPGGWNDPPPCPTGEPVRQASDAYRRGYDQIKWNKEADHAGSQ
jgi:hypothetical protein